jgi:hypothetical protein
MKMMSKEQKQLMGIKNIKKKKKKVDKINLLLPEIL